MSQGFPEAPAGGMPMPMNDSPANAGPSGDMQMMGDPEMQACLQDMVSKGLSMEAAMAICKTAVVAAKKTAGAPPQAPAQATGQPHTMFGRPMSGSPMRFTGSPQPSKIVRKSVV